MNSKAVPSTSDAISSPLATGGAGERFEQRVDAYALALLLARSTAPVLLDAVVTEVSLQTRHLGWCTDDLLIVGEVRPGVARKLAIQVKRSFTVAASDEDCAETIGGMWDDFVAVDRFDPTVDRLAIATLRGTATLLRDFESLLMCAHAATSAADFRRRLELDGFVSQKAKSQNDALLQILRAHLAQEPDEELYVMFLRVLTVLNFDLGTTSSQTDAMMLSLLAHVAKGTADPAAAANAAWMTLLDVASEGRQSAKTYRREDLPAALLETHQTVPAADDRARLDLIEHGRTVRAGIRTTIAGSYTVDRGKDSTALFEALDVVPITVVTGAAGSGKSALAKSLLDRLEAERPILAFQAVEFATAHVNETLANTQAALNARSLLALLAAHDRTIILIDGVERLLEHSVRDAFAQFLNILAGTTSLRVVLTCRDYSLETVRSALLEPAGFAHRVVEVGPLSDEELDAVADAVEPLVPPLHDARMRTFLRTPYLLDIAARLDWVGAPLPQSVRALREKCWRDLVCDEAHPAGGMPGRREVAFIDVARRRATELRPYVNAGVLDFAALDALRKASLLEVSPESDKLFAPAHDVLEDWAILQALDDVASTADDMTAALAAAVGGFPAMRRGLRRWLAERFETDPVNSCALILAASERADLPQYFRDDCIVSALLSDAAPAFLGGCRERVAAGNTDVLRRVVQLLRVACKRPPAWLPVGGLPSSMLIPNGPAWTPVLELVADNLPAAPDGDALLALGLVEDWSRQLHIAMSAPSGADAVGRIISALLPLFDGYGFNDARKRTFQVLLKIPNHAPVFAALIQRARAGDREDRHASEFADMLVSAMEGAFACRDAPDAVIDILRIQLTGGAVSRRGYSPSALDIDEFFGLRSPGMNEFFPASALQGPFHTLFQRHPTKAVAFVIELLNHAGKNYGLLNVTEDDLEPATLVTLDVPDTGGIEQWVNGRLFVLYRGMSVGPYVLQSALMALEAWLLMVAGLEEVDLEGWLLHILRESNNAMSTGVVASICVAHPKRAGRAALALLSSRTVIQLDRSRMAGELSSGIEFLAGLNPSHILFESERKKSNGLAHRQQDLESAAIQLQFTDGREAVWALIDRHRAELSDQQGEESRIWKLALHRMDVRGFVVVEEQPAAELDRTADSKPVFLEPGNLEPEVRQMVDASRDRMATITRHLKLKRMADAAWANRTGTEAADWRTLLTDARALENENDQMEVYARGGPGVAAAVCIRDRLIDLTPDELEWCIARVVRELEGDIDDHDPVNTQSTMFGADRAAAAVVALLVTRVPEQLPIDRIDLLTRALTHPVHEVVDYAYGGAGAFLGPEDDDLVLRCAAAAVCAADARDEVRAEQRKRNVYGGDDDSLIRDRTSDAIHDALAASADTARKALTTLTFDSWEGRHAATRILKLFSGRPDSPESRAFVQQCAAWLADTCDRDRHGRHHNQRDFHSEYDFRDRIAKFVLALTADAARQVCEPLIKLVASAPDEAALFLTDLIANADGRGPDDSFWPLWQEIADATVNAPWCANLNRERPYGQSLVDSLFLRAPWQAGVKSWPRLDGHAHRLHALGRALPAGVALISAYTRFLYTIGRQELPGAFVVLDSLLTAAGGVGAVSGSGIAFELETLLGQFVYAQPFRLKSDPALRDAVLRLLDALVSCGSAAAYRMRDDFVTPSRPATAAVGQAVL
jgi:hypothetical protein